MTFDPTDFGNRAMTKEEHDALVALRNRPVTQEPMHMKMQPAVHTPRKTWLENFIDSLLGVER